jgi:uncharacterized protein (TIGR03435 family)
MNHHKDVSSGAALASFKATNTSMADLADALGRTLPGKLDFTLIWVPDQANDSDSSGASLLTAIQEQLGQSTKGPVQVIVVDSAEKPSEN